MSLLSKGVIPQDTYGRLHDFEHVKSALKMPSLTERRDKR